MFTSWNDHSNLDCDKNAYPFAPIPNNYSHCDQYLNIGTNQHSDI
jgi:hypothetical protein